MTKNFKTIFILSALMFSLLIGVNNSSAATLATTLKGRILLQVEQNGEAWYVNPVNSLRYYLGRPADAFNVMRELGLGISNKDFDSFNGYAPSRLSGRILLKVADSGKAYYVNTNDLKMYYLGRPADAFNVMRELGLGITDKNLSLISIANIAGWKTYSNTQYGFGVDYPDGWKIFGTKPSIGISFGKTGQEPNYDGELFLVVFTDRTADTVLNSLGDRLVDPVTKQESIIIDGTPATLQIITSDELKKTMPSWESDKVVFEKNGYTFVLSNGAIKSDLFEKFYKSFRFTN